LIGTLAIGGWPGTFGTIGGDWAGCGPAQSPSRCTKCKAGYTLATQSNSTRSTLLKVNEVDRVALTPYILATQSKRRSTFGRQKAPTVDRVDGVGDNVDRDKLSNLTLSPNKSATKSKVLTTVGFVPSVYIPGLTVHPSTASVPTSYYSMWHTCAL